MNEETEIANETHLTEEEVAIIALLWGPRYERPKNIDRPAIRYSR